MRRRSVTYNYLLMSVLPTPASLCFRYVNLTSVILIPANLTISKHCSINLLSVPRPRARITDSNNPLHACVYDNGKTFVFMD